MYSYAQINEENIVISVSRLSGEIEAVNMIVLTEYDDSLLGKRFSPETGEFEEVEQPPYEPEPDKLQQMQEVVDTMLGEGE